MSQRQPTSTYIAKHGGALIRLELPEQVNRFLSRGWEVYDETGEAITAPIRASPVSADSADVPGKCGTQAKEASAFMGELIRLERQLTKVHGILLGEMSGSIKLCGREKLIAIDGNIRETLRIVETVKTISTRMWGGG